MKRVIAHWTSNTLGRLDMFAANNNNNNHRTIGRSKQQDRCLLRMYAAVELVGHWVFTSLLVFADDLKWSGGLFTIGAALLLCLIDRCLDCWAFGVVRHPVVVLDCVRLFAVACLNALRCVCFNYEWDGNGCEC